MPFHRSSRFPFHIILLHNDEENGNGDAEDDGGAEDGVILVDQVLGEHVVHPDGDCEVIRVHRGRAGSRAHEIHPPDKDGGEYRVLDDRS